MDIQLPYESFVHHEIYVPNSYYLAQPVGKLACVQFTKVDDKLTCILIDIQNHKLTTQSLLSTVFHNDLVGTTVQGTFLYYESRPCFVIHNIFYYNNEPVTLSYSEKYKLIETILSKYILNENMSSSQCMFFLPVTSFSIQTIDAPYKIFCIKIMGTKIVNYIDKSVLKLFWVHSTDIKDIYEIYTLDNKLDSIAHVDTCKRSVMLSKLFKKEIPIDSIEESDDEEIFESKQIKMFCKWNDFVKKWVPIKVDLNSRLKT
jgi:hypothetical protein